MPSYHYYGSYSSFVEDFIASNLNYGRWRTQMPTRAFESHYENLMQSSLTHTKLTARAFPASRHCPGYLQPPTETPRCSYSMMLWRTVAPQQRHQDREDRLYAGCEIRTRGARKRVPANQPAEQEPSPRQADATRNKAAILTTALTALIEGEWICLQSPNALDKQCMAA